MSATESALPPSASVLQREFSLAELIDLNSFRDVCDSYAELFQISFKIFSHQGEMLIDAKGNSGDLCTYAFQFPTGKSRCMQEVSAIRSLELSDQPVSYDCFTGQRYRIAPIRHEGDQLGRVVYGPYWPQGATPTDLSDLGEKFKPEIAQRLLAKVPRVAPEVVDNVLKHLVQVVEVMIYTGYKQMLTSRLHVEAVSTSYTELQNKTKQLRESYQRLKELDRLKSSFLATVSHELRTPLTSVIGYSEMLLEGLAGDLQPEQRDYVKTIMDKGENLLGLIASILDFSKVESGNLRLSVEQIDVRSVIDAAVSTVIPIARKRNVNVEAAVPADIPPVSVDGGKLRQALVNIMGNAVKFNRDGGTVKVEAGVVNLAPARTPDEDIPAALAPAATPFIRIAIADTGIGIPAENLERVFDSFYQVDGSSTREYGGTGLGLAISNNYIQAHGGRIEVESEYGKGSTFTILLPLQPAG